jgi:hypothetical protein
VGSRLAEDERGRTLFREINERIAELGGYFSLGGTTPFVCECGDGGCLQALELTHAEYEEVRAHATRFVVALDHENPEVEKIVSRNGMFAVVQTILREAFRIDEETDPRAPGRLATERTSA